MRADIRRGPHFDSGDNADGEEGGHQRASAVAEKRQRQSDDREQTKADADIDEDLEEEH